MAKIGKICETFLRVKNEYSHSDRKLILNALILLNIQNKTSLVMVLSEKSVSPSRERRRTGE